MENELDEYDNETEFNFQTPTKVCCEEIYHLTLLSQNRTIIQNLRKDYLPYFYCINKNLKVRILLDIKFNYVF